MNYLFDASYIRMPNSFSLALSSKNTCSELNNPRHLANILEENKALEYHPFLAFILTVIYRRTSISFEISRNPIQSVFSVLQFL